MIRLGALLGLIVLAGGCQACGQSSESRDAAQDRVNTRDVADAAPSLDAGVAEDARPSPPWADGSLMLDRSPAPAMDANVCGNAQWLTIGFPRDARDFCVHEGWLYGNESGASWRLQLSQPGVVELLFDIDHPGPARCRSQSIVFEPFEFYTSHAAAIIDFPDVTGVGRVLWSHQFRDPDWGAQFDARTDEIAVSDQLLAWTWKETNGPWHFMVAGPHGESPHEPPLPPGLYPIYLQADGPHLVFTYNNDIWLWTVGTDAPENLTQNAADQWYPWISGNRVVWVDQRDNPSGTLWSPNNPEIYAMDLTTRQVTRITHDAPDHPVLQHAPMVSGDWVVWMDFRNAAQPNPSQYFTDVMEIWGYNFVTQREYPVLTGPVRASFPRVDDGMVYVACSPPFPDQRSGVFRQPLPPAN